MTTILTKEALTKGIKGYKDKAAKMDATLHQLALSALYYMNRPEVQDIGYAQRLIDSLGKSTRNETLKAWFMHNGKCTIKENIVKFSNKKDITPENWEIKVLALADMPFWSKPEKSAESQLKELDAEAMLIALFKRLAKAEVVQHPELFNRVWEVLPDSTKAKVMA